MKNEIFRPLQLVLAGFLSLVLLTFAVSSWLTWREQELLSQARSEMQTVLAFQRAHHLVELQLIALTLEGAGPPVEKIVRDVDKLLTLCPESSQEVPRQLNAFKDHLRTSDPLDPSSIVQLFAMFREVADLEAKHELEILARLQRETNAQLRYELAAPLVLLAVSVLLVPITRRRIMNPLEDFGRQINGLASGDYSPPPDEQVSELTLPIHRSFIEFAKRLQKLEHEHREREASLEDEVRTATSALLEQQRSLARAERLAATGELAASVAHELRNPLAGIQMSLSNLRSELTDPELVDRVGAIVSEVERLARLLSGLVETARHQPESSSVVGVADLVDELMKLTRYQLASNIHLESRIEEGLRCRLPKERLRQALLNLVLNSAKAIGHEGGTIRIEARGQDDDAHFSIRDDGPGFPAELLENGIRPFYSTRERGTGLGLAMVRRFVAETQGRIELANCQPQGERPGALVKLLLPSTVEHG